MPALPDVPNVIRLQLNYTLGADTVNMTRLFWRYGGTPPTSAALNSWCAQLSLTWAGSIGAQTTPQTSLTSIIATDLSTTSSGQGSDSTTHAGTAAGAPNAGGTAVLVNYIVARRYRGGKPRSYLPMGTASDVNTEQAWKSSSITAFTSAINSFFNYITSNPPAGATSMAHVNVSYYKGFTVFTTSTGRAKNVPTLRPTPLVDVITSFIVDPAFGTQRRRSRK